MDGERRALAFDAFFRTPVPAAAAMRLVDRTG